MEPPLKPGRCVVCAQPATKLKCVKCKTPYCSTACQTVDWKERGHKKECKRLVKANAAAVAKGSGEATAKPKAVPPVVDGPARSRPDVAHARAAAAAATLTTATAPESEHWRGISRCPVCFEDWDENLAPYIRFCCCKYVCRSCDRKWGGEDAPCPICRTPWPKSIDKQLAMLRSKVESDNPAAISSLGSFYADGDLGLVPSLKKAARLFQRAADLGDVLAMYNLGAAYLKGEGVKLDKKNMVKYFRMAADRGHARAQFNLGCCYHEAVGVAQDYAEAMRFLKMAAEQGFTQAEYHLGIIYTSGEGVMLDDAEATRWIERAAAKGHEDAKAALALVHALVQARRSFIPTR